MAKQAEAELRELAKEEAARAAQSYDQALAHSHDIERTNLMSMMNIAFKALIESSLGYATVGEEHAQLHEVRCTAQRPTVVVPCAHTHTPCARMHRHRHTHAHAQAHAHTRSCPHAHTHVHDRACAHSQAHAHRRPAPMRMPMSTHTHARTHVFCCCSVFADITRHDNSSLVHTPRSAVC